MRLVDDPDSTIECPPTQCGACQADLVGASEFSRQRRQVIELPPPKAKVTEYRVVSLVLSAYS
jgi:transposase